MDLELLKEHTSNLTQLLNQMIRIKSVKTISEAGSLVHRPQTDPWLEREFGVPRTSPDRWFATMHRISDGAGWWHDIYIEQSGL